MTEERISEIELGLSVGQEIWYQETVRELLTALREAQTDAYRYGNLWKLRAEKAEQERDALSEECMKAHTALAICKKIEEMWAEIHGNQS